MKQKFYYFVTSLLLVFSCSMATWAQSFSIASYPTFSNNNGSGTVTFNFQNTNNYDVIITAVEGIVSSAGANTAYVYYNTTPINGALSSLIPANGWLLAGTNNFNSIANDYVNFFDSLGLVVPANSTLGIAVFATNQRYFSMTSSPTFSNGGCNMLTGTNISYGNNTPPTAPSIAMRGWIGKITFVNAAPCTAPPNAGNAVASSINVCGTNQNISLNLANNSAGAGQTYEWESSPSNTPFVWTSMGAATSGPSRTVPVSATTWYRCKVTCSTQVAYSAPVQVNFGMILPAGTYTINPNGSGANNFASLEDFVATLNNCGIAGPIVANVAPNVVTRNRIQFNDIVGASATNTIRINGNGSLISYAGTTSLLSNVELNGTKYLTLDSFNIECSNVSNAVGIHIWNGANFDSITRCTIDQSTVTSTSSTVTAGIAFAGSRTNITTTGNNASNIFIAKNRIIGNASSNYGTYSGISMYGSAVGSHSNITIEENEIINFYYYGLNLRNGSNIKVRGNKIYRSTKSTLNTTVYGIYTTNTITDLLIENNRIFALHGTHTSYTSMSYPIYIGSTGSTAALPLRIINNGIYDNNTPIYGIYVNSSNVGTQISHNTIDGSLKTYNTTSNVYGIYSWATNYEVKNNIIHLPNLSSTNGYGIYNVYTTATAGSLNGNVVKMSGSGVNYPWYYSGNYTSLAALRTAYPTMEANGSEYAPYIANISSGNLLPTNTQLYRAGAPTVPLIATDMDGVNRFTTNPTPGAREMEGLPSQVGIELAAIHVKDLLCTNSDSLKVEVINQSNVPVTNFTVNYYLNGVAQTPVVINSSIPVSGSGIFYVATLPFTANTNTLIGVKVSLPNNVASQFIGIDSLYKFQGIGMSGVYTVDAANPSLGTNFNSVADMQDALTIRGLCSTVVINFVANTGPYTGNIVLKDIKGLNATTTLTINGNNNLIEYNGTIASPHLLVLDNTPYTTIQNINFKATNVSYGWGALITNNSRNVTLKRNVFDLTSVTSSSSTYANGITVSGSYTSPNTSVSGITNISIDSNQVLGTTAMYGLSYGLVLSSNSTLCSVTNNTISNFYSYGLYSGAINSIIDNNIIENTSKTGGTTKYGIYQINAGLNTKITRNKIFNLGGLLGNGTSVIYPIYMATSSGTAAQPLIVANNLMYGNQSNATNYGVYISSTSNSRLYHNTVIIDKENTSSNATYGVYFSGTNSSFEIKNNIINITNAGIGAVYGYYFSSTPTFALMQRNNIFIDLPNRTNAYHSYVGGANRLTLAALQTAYPTMEVGSLSINPAFVNPVIANYMPGIGAVALYQNGEAVTAIVPTDIEGTTRNALPTPGAYEMAMPVNHNAAMLGLGANICEGTNSPVWMIVRNAGLSTLDSAKIHWSVNGVPQPVFNYVGPLASGDNDTIVVGTYTFAGQYTIKGWSHLPNGFVDPVNTNDTFETTVYAALNGNYTINSAVATGGSNYQSITDFTDALSLRGVCGPVVATIATGSGPYTERVIFGNYNGSSATNTITLNGNNTVVQYNATTSAELPLLTFNNAKFIKVNEVIFTALNASNGWGALFTNGAEYDSLTNCQFNLMSVTSTSSTSTSGIVFSGSTTSPTTSATFIARNCYVGNNKIWGNRTGMYGNYYMFPVNSGTDSCVIENNEIADFYMYGLYVTGGNYNKFFNNNIHRANKASTSTFYGLYLANSKPGTIVSGNRIHSPAGINSNTGYISYAIYLNGTQGTAAAPMVLSNNIVYNQNQGSTIYGLYSTSATYAKIYHNTIVFDRQTGASTNYGMYFTSTHTGSELENNIIAYYEGGTSTKYGYYFNTTNAIPIAQVQRNNVYMGSTRAGTQYHSYNGANRATLVDLQTAYPGIEAGSLSIDPLFTNIAQGNLKPTVGAAALYDNGLNVSVDVPTDITGIIRPIAPTPGAFQMDDIVNDNASVVSVDSPTVYCAGVQNIYATISNQGLNRIDSVRINWSVNGVLQPTVNYTGVLYSPASPNTPTAVSVNLGAVNLPNGASDIVIWTSHPNGRPDMFTGNDTLSTYITSRLVGTYTVNPSAPISATNYHSVAAVADDLNNKGVCGPVVVNVQTGSAPFNERLYLGEIYGTSAINTVTFNGNGATLQHNATTSEAHLVKLIGTKYVKINDFTFKSTNTSYGWGAIINGGAEYDSITNCTFDLSLVTNTNSSYCNGITFTGSLTNPTTTHANIAKHIYIGGNTIQAAVSNGINYAASLMQGADSIIFDGNTFADYYLYGLYSSGTINGAIIKNNIFHRANKTSVTTFYGIYTTGTRRGYHEISGNRIYKPGGVNGSTSTLYGIYIVSPSTTATDTFRIFNNALYDLNIGGTMYPIYVTTPGVNFDIIHNTVQTSHNNTGTYYGIYVSGTSTNGKLQNNLVTLPSGSSTAYGYYFSSTNGFSQANIQRNNVFRSATAGSNHYHSYFGGNRTNLSDLQAAYPAIEVGSYAVDPQFVNIAAGNLGPANPLLHTNGLNWRAVVEADINDFPRPNNPTVGAFEKPLSAGNDLELMAVLGPDEPFCPSAQNVAVAIRNYGTNQLNNFPIHWSINGVSQNPFTYTGTLDTFGGAGIYIDTVTLLAGNFVYGANTIKVWSALNPDVNRNNDTLAKVIQVTRYTIAASTDTTCFGGNVTLNIAQPNLPNSSTIQWQNSLNNALYNNIIGANGVTTTQTLNTNTYFRAAIEINNTICYTDTVSVVTIDPTVLSTTGAVRCGPGSVVLSASAGAGVTLRWFENRTGGTVLGTGSNFNTPIVSATDTFFVEGYHAGGDCASVRVAVPVTIDFVPIFNLGPDVTSCMVDTNTMHLLDATAIGGISYLWNTNATTPSINVNQNGTYIVTVSSANGCHTSDTILIAMRYQPQLDLIPDTALCIGDSLTLDGTTIGADSYLWSTGSANPSINVGQTGNYVLTINTNQGCTAKDSVAVSVNVLPEVDLGADINKCVEVGHLEFLNARNPGNDYLWDDSYNGQVRVVDASGTYFVQVTNEFGCSATDTIQVNFKYKPEIDLGNDTLVCNSTSLSLNAGTGGISYIWNTGETTPTITTRQEGLYYVHVTSDNGCTNADSIEITFSGNAPRHSGIWVRSLGGNTFRFELMNPLNISSYEWDFGDNSPVSMSANPTHTYSTTGNFVVRLKVFNHCGNALDTTTVHILSTTDINELGKDWTISLYPNPSKEKVAFKTDASVKIHKVEVVSSVGQIVLTEEFQQNEEPVIDVSHLGSAMYHIQIHTNKGITTRKLNVVK